MEGNRSRMKSRRSYRYKRIGLGLCLLSPLMSLDLPADVDFEQARELVESGKIMTLEEILRKSIVVRGKRILEIEFEVEDDEYMYEIEVLGPGGQIIEYYLDATSGDLIKTVRGED